MANHNVSIIMYFLIGFILCLLLCVVDALRGGDDRFFTVKTSSLFPSSVCNPSTQGHNKRESSLKLVHRNGPCSSQGNAKNSPTISQILSQDQTRVSLIQSRINLASKTTNKETESKLDLPSQSGESLGSGNYIVNVGLGTPKKTLSLVIDTGSDLSWTQCEPCSNCYNKKEPMFYPYFSRTYSWITCTTSECGLLHESSGLFPRCYDSRCVYNMGYNDNSSSRGYLGADTLTLPPTDVVKFIFGCGILNNGFSGQIAGLLGLGRAELSFVSQTSQKYGKYFSYCFPSKSSSTGHLSFGKNSVPENVKFTPFSQSSETSNHYSIDLVAIYVAGTELSVPKADSSSGMVIDSGTVITRLPEPVYKMLSETFKKLMIKYPIAPPEVELLDTCYDFTNFTSISVPKISFLFSGDVMVDLDYSGILYGDNPSQMCLAFSGTNGFIILGNVQQKTLEVVYDVAGGKLGFGARGCA